MSDYSDNCTDSYTDNYSEDQELVALIRAAGDYVVPSDNLRPRIIEAAREQARDRLGRQRLWLLAVAALLCAVISVPISRGAKRLRDRTAGPSAAEMQLRAKSLSQQSGIGPDWGMYEAFRQWKDDTAIKFK